MKFSKFDFISCTVSSANPCVITAVEHELAVDDVIWLEATAMPTGLTADTNYYVINDGITANTFRISDRPRGDALATSSTGTAVTFQKQNRARLWPTQEDNR